MSPLPAGARWSDAALTLFEAEGEIAVSAAAGAGKTTALVELLRRRIAGAGPGPAIAPREVVAITFTERAGAELVARLGRELADGARELAERGDDDGAGRLAAALRELPSLAVGTIHGWAAGLLRQHALEAGIDPDFGVLDEEAAGELLSTATLSALVAALDRGDAGARRLVAAMGGARAVADAVGALVRERATRGLAGDPGWVEGDPAAVEAARARLLEAASTLAGMAGRPTTATGQQALVRLGRAVAEVAGAASLPDAAAEARRLGPLAAALTGWRTGKKDPAELLAARDRLLEGARTLPPLAAELAAGPLAMALAGVVAEATRRYGDAKARARGLDFDDLLVRARDLLRGSPAVAADVRTRVRALLVDEYQDVNGLQAEIFDLLAPPLRVAVGDAKQSIYRFRGADVTVFAGLIGRLGGGGGRVVHLRENHRSVPGVVELVNGVFAGGGAVLGVPFGPEDHLLAMRGGGAMPAAECLEDPGDPATPEERRLREARAVAARAAEIVAGGRRPGEVAVLFRRLTHVATFERALREAGLPVRVARGGGFHQAPEVRDLGELCASLEEPGDEVAWAALLRSPLCALSDGSLVALARRGLSRLAHVPPDEAGVVLDAARGDEAPAGEAARLRRFLATWQELRASRRRLDVGEALTVAVERLDLEAALLAGPDGERRAGNLRKALVLARRQADLGATPADFAARLRRLALAPAREPEADGGDGEAISLLTVHQAKGLEWPVVFVPDLAARPPSAQRRPVLDEAGRVAVPLPGHGGEGTEETATTARLRAAAAAAEAAESQRLLYVALTRARDRLVLSGASGRVPAGSWAEAVSRIPPGLLERRQPPPWPPGVAAPLAPEAPPPGPPRLRAAPPPSALRFPVTGLAEYARCPRRHWMGSQMRLPEPRPETGGDRRAGDDPDRATFRGTLAHALLAEVDLGAPAGPERRALIEAAAARRGEDPRRPAVREIVEEVEGYLGTGEGMVLGAASLEGALRRELPFVIRLDGGREEGIALAEAGAVGAGAVGAGAVYLDGSIDALVVAPDGVRVVDFKFARYRAGAEERYRFQLAAYALAATRAFPDRPFRAELHYLRGGGRSVDVTPAPGDLDRLAKELPALARAAARGEGRDAPPADLGRDRDRCTAEGCGFVVRCFGDRPGSGVV